ncbi:HlyD family secretion protein [Rhodopseudomonas sp. HC1]|uniref:HlyD family secretion protein n=1 Tax=Rhodopseudomonas infernalis TaxID=2897386 RepID=UPI001EE922A9|nr:HlyD family secretion protein [Rhodopseudomonas infernalis]MCG6207893.1 HlyD family secretion protein [Rhodopseudomonas infernalis]
MSAADVISAKGDGGPKNARPQDAAELRDADLPATARTETDRSEAKVRSPAPSTETETEHPPRPPGGLRGLIRQHPVAAIVGAVVIAAAIVGGILWWLHARNYESSDDAFIDTRSVLISPQVSGAITGVNVTDNQVVKAGDLLATIDQRDYKAADDQAAAQILQAQASITDIEAQIGAQQAQIQQANQQVQEAQAAYNFSIEENQRYQELVQKGAGTVQRAQQAESDFRAKKAALDAANAASLAANRQVDVLRAKAEQAKAQVQAAQAQKEQADANLQRTQLRAPTDGRIAKLTGAVGALASPGQAIMVLVPLDIWVTANFKETQLELMRVGQSVDIHIDAYGKTYPGHVNSIQAGSGTAFSLLPAENATGNYVKVVQRVPVKITFDRRPDVALGPGMSVVPTVTVRP